MERPDVLYVEQQYNVPDGVLQQVRAIYEAAFPEAERVAFAGIEFSIRQGRRQLFTAEAGEEVAGFAVLLPLSDTGVHLLEYFAVGRALRSSGIGTGLLRAIVDALTSCGHVSGIILEVEPVESASDPGTSQRERRIAFYRRLGADFITGVEHYAMPNQVSPGTLEMQLMWLPIREPLAALTTRRLVTCIRRIYEESYGLEPDHPLMQAAQLSAE